MLSLYTALHHVLPGAWLHNAECELHTAESIGATIRASYLANES
jgi:hypothetical protein